MYILNIIFGWVSHNNRDLELYYTPWYDKLHSWNTAALVILSIVDMFLGLQLYENVTTTYYIFFWVWIGIALTVIIGAEFYNSRNLERMDMQTEEKHIDYARDSTFSWRAYQGNRDSNRESRPTSQYWPKSK